MLQIPCPWCGTRDEAEFRFGGELHVDRPAPACSDAEWAEYLFNRKNTRGQHEERWCHSDGCGRWFRAARDTRTHEIVASRKFDPPKPEQVRRRESTESAA